jgi:hypothetical protein
MVFALALNAILNHERYEKHERHEREKQYAARTGFSWFSPVSWFSWFDTVQNIIPMCNPWVAEQGGPSLGELDNLLIGQESGIGQRFLDISWLQVRI